MLYLLSSTVSAQLLLRHTLHQVLAAVQAYVVCELQDKLNVLWAFIKAHLKVSLTFCSWQGQKLMGLQSCNACQIAQFERHLEYDGLLPATSLFICSIGLVCSSEYQSPEKGKTTTLCIHI